MQHRHRRRHRQHDVGPDDPADHVHAVLLQHLVGELLADVGLALVVAVDHLGVEAADLAAEGGRAPARPKSFMCLPMTPGRAGQGRDEADLQRVGRAGGSRGRAEPAMRARSSGSSECAHGGLLGIREHGTKMVGGILARETTRARAPSLRSARPAAAARPRPEWRTACSALARRRRALHPRPHLEAGGAQPAADRDLVLHPKGLLLDPRHHRADAERVAVAHRREEARARLHGWARRRCRTSGTPRATAGRARRRVPRSRGRTSSKKRG